MTCKTPLAQNLINSLANYCNGKKLGPVRCVAFARYLETFDSAREQHAAFKLLNAKGVKCLTVAQQAERKNLMAVAKNG